MSKMYALIICIGTIFLSLCSWPLVQKSYRFGIGGTPIICVPVDDVLEPTRVFTHPSVSIVPREYPVDLFIFHYNAARVLNVIPGFHLNRDFDDNGPTNSLSGDISIVDRAYERLSLGMAAGDDVEKIWDRSAPCEDPIIKSIPGTQDYLARCDMHNIWHILFDRKPGFSLRPNNLYDTVLAECVQLDVDKGAKLENCTRRIFVKKFRVDYEFQIENARLIPDMDAFIRAKESGWENDCRRPSTPRAI